MKREVNKIRKELGIAKDQRIGQQIVNQLTAHDYFEDDLSDTLFFIQDEVLLEVLKDRDDFARKFRKMVKGKKVVGFKTKK